MNVWQPTLLEFRHGNHIDDVPQDFAFTQIFPQFLDLTFKHPDDHVHVEGAFLPQIWICQHRRMIRVGRHRDEDCRDSSDLPKMQHAHHNLKETSSTYSQRLNAVAIHCLHLHLPATKSGGEHDGATDVVVLLPSHPCQQSRKMGSRGDHQILGQTRSDVIEVIVLHSHKRFDSKLLREFAAGQLDLQRIPPVQFQPA
jgi:hypothetical protein